MFAKTIALIFVSVCLTSNCCAQNAEDMPITANWNNASRLTVERDITRLTGLIFWDPTQANFFITAKVQKKPLREVLNEVFLPRGYTWKIVQNGIAIKKMFVLQGQVLNRKNEPVSYATVAIKGTRQSTASDQDGKFSLTLPDANFIILITAIGYKEQEKRIRGNNYVTIILETSISNLAQVSVNAAKTSKVYKKNQNSPPAMDTLPPNVPNTKTGSVYTINNSIFNLTPSQNITDRLSAFTGAVLPNTNTTPGSNQSPITMRNRITIIGYPHLLVVLNGSPYEGDINNINPNDIESLTLVKDAAASTQLGIHAGNGVLMITTKNSSYDTPTTVTATANFSIGTKPNLSYLPYMSSADHIELTKVLYDSGYYDNLFAHSPWFPFPPAVEILHREKMGLISAADAETALAALRNTDIRQQAQKHLYQTSIHQQYHVGVQGGNKVYRFNFTQGYDIAKWNLIGNGNTRFTMYLNHAIKAGKKGPEIFNIINCTQNIINNNGIDQENFQNPYVKLADGQGNALSVPKTLNQAYKDSIGRTAKLLNWDYNPLEEIGLGNNKITNTAIHITLGIKYRFLKKLDATVTYRHETEISEHINRHSEHTYFTRDIINQFSQIDSSSSIYRPIPLGAIIDRNIIKRNVGNINTQLKYDVVNNESNSLTFYTGYEIRHIKISNKKQRDYGVTGNGIKAVVDHTTFFSSPYDPGITKQIPYPDDNTYTNEHYYAIYANGVYTWKKRLAASFTYRKDESNIFGVQANQKGVPLLAAGVSWDMNLKDHRLFPMLRLKLSNGLCSNASKSVSSLTGLQTLGINSWNAPISVIVNPPNPWLSWETVRISNIGLDFSLLNNHIWGTTDFFVKQANNLLGMAPIDPTSGVSIFQGNVAAMKGHGLEAAINTKTGGKKLQWQSTILMSYVRDRVTKYSIQQPSLWYYCDPRYINPLPGMPLFSIYSLPFQGLDSNNGDPIGLIANQMSKNYNAILQSPNLSDLVYHGPATPTFYGSFRNTITWKQFEFGFNIVWKGGYYFRTSSINYNAVMKGEVIGHSDIAKRWQKPGDERWSKIPSLRIPVDYSRDLFFNYSSALVQKGDHIRLQDIRMKYHLNKKQSGKCMRSATEFYIYANNIGLLWKANNQGIDPDYVNSLLQPLLITIGTKIEF
jgi:TonB-dependent SusC/RagA subfamily outer membrane receptor